MLGVDAFHAWRQVLSGVILDRYTKVKPAHPGRNADFSRYSEVDCCSRSHTSLSSLSSLPVIRMGLPRSHDHDTLRSALAHTLSRTRRFASAHDGEPSSPAPCFEHAFEVMCVYGVSGGSFPGTDQS